MPKKRVKTRRKPRGYLTGLLDVRYAGYGFVQTAEGEFFIPKSKMGPAFNGDLVQIAPLPKGASSGDQGPRPCPCARVVSVVDRAHEVLVGRYEVAEPFGVVVPEDPRFHHDIFTMRSDNPSIPDGALVKVRIVTFPDRRSAATGIIEEVLGSSDDPQVDSELIIARHKIETAFSEASVAQAQECTLDCYAALKKGYRDLRDRFIFTVDPLDAKDFDDAVSLDAVKDESGATWRLGVHIADVSEYVSWGSSIDLDARRRATSVYLADSVIPMLPERLSNDLCSLRPLEDRLTMTIDLYVDDAAIVKRFEVYPAIICSRRRLTYDEAQSFLSGEDSGNGNSAGCDEDLLRDKLIGLSRIAGLREAARIARGGMEFESPEAKVILDARGNPTGYTLRRKTMATSLIEEAMIMANEAAAQKLLLSHVDAPFRVHEAPSPDGLEGLIPVFREFDWFSDVDEYAFVTGNAQVLSSVLEASKGRPEGVFVSSLLLRSMKRAVYKPVCEEHFGLASKAYTHFTSPIRRYPDLLVHRALKSLCLKDKAYALNSSQTESLTWLCEHASQMERIAEKAARESQECKLLRLMENQIGQHMQGVISGVMTYGFYVRLENTLEGLVELSRLDGQYYAFDPIRRSLVGEETGAAFRLGQEIGVKVLAVDPRSATLDLSVCRR